MVLGLGEDDHGVLRDEGNTLLYSETSPVPWRDDDRRQESCGWSSYGRGGGRRFGRPRIRRYTASKIRKKGSRGAHDKGKVMDKVLAAETHQARRNPLGDVAAAADSGEKIGQSGGTIQRGSRGEMKRTSRATNRRKR